MGEHRSLLLDAGLELIAAQGMGGLTHEAVDATGHAPAGSTEERFPTRETLIEGVTQRCNERELEMATGPGPEIEASPEGNATAFGAFVSLVPGRDGLLHISELRKISGGKRVENVDDVVKVGDKVQVEIKEIDPRGKLSLVPVVEGDGASGSGSASASE